MVLPLCWDVGRLILPVFCALCCIEIYAICWVFHRTNLRQTFTKFLLIVQIISSYTRPKISLTFPDAHSFGNTLVLGGHVVSAVEPIFSDVLSSQGNAVLFEACNVYDLLFGVISCSTTHATELIKTFFWNGLQQMSNGLCMGCVLCLLI